jgi:hypothetical protein
MTMTLEALPQTAQYAPGAGGDLLIEAAGDGYSYHVRVTDRDSGKSAHVQVDGDALLETLELINRITLAVIQAEELDEDRVESVDASELEHGDEFYVCYLAEAEADGDHTASPEGLMIEAIESREDDTHVVLALAELPTLQMHLATLLMAGLHR